MYLGRYFDFHMSNKEHKTKLLDKTKEILNTIESLLLHPKNKLLLFQRYLLSKISWDLTVADIPITWVKENLDNVASQYIRFWLEIPVSGTLEIIRQSRSKFGLSVTLPSDRYTQCQVSFRNNLKSSKNVDIVEIHKVTRDKNITYDQYRSTRDAIKCLREQSEVRIDNLTLQGLVLKSIKQFVDKGMINLWHKALSSLPANIYSYSIRYLNNTLANNTNLKRWGKTNSSTCPLHDHDQTLGHVIGGCKKALEEGRYNWRHDSVLHAIASALKALDSLNIYCDVESFLSPSIVTGDTYRPDIVVTKDDQVFVIELTVGFETNIAKNSLRKAEKYKIILGQLTRQFRSVKFVNLSMGSLGVIGHDTFTLEAMFTAVGLKREATSYLIRKVINIAIRTSYYIFCCRNKAWEQPSLLTW